MPPSRTSGRGRRIGKDADGTRFPRLAPQGSLLLGLPSRCSKRPPPRSSGGGAVHRGVPRRKRRGDLVPSEGGVRRVHGKPPAGLSREIPLPPLPFLRGPEGGSVRKGTAVRRLPPEGVRSGSRRTPRILLGHGEVLRGLPPGARGRHGGGGRRLLRDAGVPRPQLPAPPLPRRPSRP
jgi:hypothetical protein